MAKRKNKKVFQVQHKGVNIGEVYRDGVEWGFTSDMMIRHSGGLEGHFGMESKKEAIKALKETHSEYV